MAAAERALLAQAEMALFGPPGAAAPPPLASQPGSFPAALLASPAAFSRPEVAGMLSEPAPAPAPVLEVSIGRLEVVAPPPAPPARRAPRMRPHTSLTSYLDRRREVMP